MVASLPRPRSEPCALQYLATLPPSTKPALPRVPTSPGHQLADAANLTPRPADSTTSAPALPPPRRSISSFNPFALPMTDAAVEALRPYRRISMSTKRRHRASMQGARQSVTLQREREPMRALTQADAAPLQRDSGVSTASAATRKSDGSRSGRDGPASLWEHVVAQSQSGLQSAHNSLVSAGGAPRRSSEESEMARFQHAGRVRSFMHAPPPAASSGMARLASEPAARMSNDSEHSAAAAALRQPTTPGGATRALPRQLSAPDRATAVLALLHNSEALPSCSGSASGHTDTDGSLTEDDARGVLGAAAATPSACFASALYATARHTQPSASASSTSSAAHNSLKVGATSTDYSSASRAPSVPSSVFGSMSAVEMSVDAPRASSVSGAEGGAQAPAKACAEEEQQSRVQRARDEHFARDLNMRVGRARQTMDYAASQRCRFSRLQIATLTVWQALDLFNELSPDPATGHTPADTAFLACEWCVHEFPEFEWAPLVSLVHDMGRLLTHPLFGGEPLWSVVNEAYPLGCEFSEHISGSRYLTACPDRRCSCYKGAIGVYGPACGLDSVHFTWTGTEYLTMVLLLNQTRLPFEAVFLLRFQNFASAIAHSAYGDLCSARDVATLPLLRRFARVLQRAHAGEAPPGPRLTQAALAQQCQVAIGRYFVADQLHW